MTSLNIKHYRTDRKLIKFVCLNNTILTFSMARAYLKNINKLELLIHLTLGMQYFREFIKYTNSKHI